MIELRPYQVEGVERILERRSLLLAMVMGSGKTVCSVAAVRKLRQRREVDCGAVFALKSTKYQWVREIAKVDPRAHVQVIEGDKRRRISGYRKALQFQYTILHYQCLVNDWDYIKDYLPIDFLIFDEVTALKGFTSKTSKRAKILSKRSPIRLGLSGQPLENRPEELFSVMEAIDPEILGRFPLFDRTFIVRDHFGRPSRYRNLHLIQERLGPAMYRKTREDIAQWLPEKVEIDLPVVLDAATMSLHNHIKADLSAAIDAAIAGGIGGGFDIVSHYGRSDSAEKAGLMGQVMSRMTAMRMVSSHPLLLRYSADQFDDPDSQHGSEYASLMKAEGLLDTLPLKTAKLEALMETMGEILDEDPAHKIVVFSYFKPMLRLISQGCTSRFPEVGWTMLTGEITDAKERYRRIERFNTDPDCRIFLSSDAGAYGVDLFQGSHLINYDLPWGAGAFAQRIARIDRTSSPWPSINVMHMYGHQTIEQRMYEMLQQKSKIAMAFIDGKFETGGGLKLDLQSLRQFLDAA